MFNLLREGCSRWVSRDYRIDVWVVRPLVFFSSVWLAKVILFSNRPKTALLSCAQEQVLIQVTVLHSSECSGGYRPRGPRRKFLSRATFRSISSPSFPAGLSFQVVGNVEVGVPDV